jgi:hypothetical protein
MDGRVVVCSSGRRVIQVLANKDGIVLYNCLDPELGDAWLYYRSMSKDGFKRRFPKCPLR